MKKFIRVIAILLVMSLLLSVTAFAETKANYVGIFELGELLVWLYMDCIEPGNDDYLSYIPEIEVESIKSIYVSEKGGYVKLFLELTEKTYYAVLEATIALQNNPCVKSVCPNYILTIDDISLEELLIKEYKDVFAPGELVVWIDMDDIESGNDDYLSLMPEIEANSIKKYYVNEKSEYVCLLLKLTEETQEAVIEAKEALENNPYVSSACPNYIMIDDANENPTYIPALGDINADGELTNADVVETARYIVGLVEFTDEQLSAADMDESGDVTNADLILMAKVVIS